MNPLATLAATLLLVGCGARSTPSASRWDRLPVRPCPRATHAARVGLWVDEWRGELAFAYDGCTVSFRHGQGDPMRYFQTPEGLRSLDTRQYAEPAGYYRARAVWDGDRLFANSVVIDRLLVGRWRADHFVVGHRPDWRMRRVTSLSSVPERVALHLFPRPVAPSRSEWLREHGWPDETPGGL